MRLRTFLSLATLLSLSACGSATVAKWAGKIYSYQVNDLAFERKQDNEIIKFDDQKSNGMLCMTSQDFMDFLTTYVVNSAPASTSVKSPLLKSPKAQ